MSNADGSQPVRRKGQAAFALLLALLIAGTVWWTLSVPHEPGRLYDAIPANAVLVSEHRNLGGRAPALVENTLVQALLTAGGVDVREAQKTLRDKAVQAWLRRLLAHESVVAYVPALGFSGQPAWVFASWIGGWSQRLRWQLALDLLPDLQPFRCRDGRFVWHLATTGTNRANATLSFAIEEGILLGCLSENPTAARFLVDVAERRASVPSARAAGTLAASRLHDRTGPPDRGWLNFGPGPGAPHLCLPPFLDVELERLAQNAVYVNAYADCGLPPAPHMGQQPSLAELDRILGDTPEAICLFPPAYIDTFCPRLVSWPAGRILEEVLRTPDGEQAAACAFVALFGGPHTGSFHLHVIPLKVPTLMAGVNTASRKDGLSRALRLLDRLNADWRLGLVPKTVSVGDRYLAAVVESTANNVYADCPIEDRAGYAVSDNWLIVSSNAKALLAILARTNGEEQDRVEPSAWRRRLCEHGAAAYGWVDIPRAGETVARALDIYALVLSLQDATSSKQVRQDVQRAKDWIRYAGAVKTCSLWLDTAEQASRLRVRAGE
ncbi:MAG: hypothetical protein JXR37_35540 [Kiritimatiellae bacterium]|nr:hypothetical protein [Kiritimatiellia bacterium]